MREKSLLQVALLRMALAFMITCAVWSIAIARNKRADWDGRSPWPVARGDNQARAATGVPYAFEGALNIIWEKRFHEKMQGPLIYSEGVLLFPGSKKRLFALDPHTGNTEAKIRLRACPQSGAVLVDSLLYVATAPPFNHVDCIRTRDEKRLWRSVIFNVAGPLVVDGDVILIPGGDGVLYALNRFSGDLLWETNFRVPILSQIIPVGEGEARGYLACAGEKVFYVAKLTGAARNAVPHWQGGSRLTGVATIGDKGLLVISTVGGMGFLLGPTSTDSADEFSYVPLDSVKLGSAAWSPPSVRDSKVIFSDNSGTVTLYAISNDTSGHAHFGSPVWRTQLGGTLVAGTINTAYHIVVGLLNRWIYSLDITNGTIVAQRELDGGIRYSPISDGHYMFVATETGSVFCLGWLNLCRD